MMNQRVARLREESVETRPYISAERAQLITEFYKSDVPNRVSVPVARALAFQYFMERRTIHIAPGELIVGERGPAPKATPTYPELCCHSLEDLQVLSDRERTRFLVSEDVRDIYTREIIPFWEGRTMRERVFELMSAEWHAAFEAGVFTEFMEQRAPGHAILDDKIYHQGLADLGRRIAATRIGLDPLEDPRTYDKLEELKAMEICVAALITFARRYAAVAEELAEQEPDEARRAELAEIARICEHVPARAPRTFQEALQSYWFVHLGVISELNTWDSFNPGRLDQHLWPFYQRETFAGTLIPERAS